MINDKYFLSMLQRAPLHTQSSLAALAASPPGPPPGFPVPSSGYHPVISRQESHPMITNTSPGPALVAQALSGNLARTDYKITK